MSTRAFFRRLIAFGLVVVALQLAIGHATLPDEILRLDEALDDGAEVLFLADSTNRAHAPDDTDKRPISELLGELLDGPRVVAVDHAAWNAQIYHDVVASLVRRARRPRAMVFALNTRSFLPGWVLRPGWQFERERFTLAHPWLGLLWQPLAVLKVVDATSVSEQQFRDAPVRVGEQVVGQVRDFLRGDPEAINTPELLAEDLALRLTCNYLGAIPEDGARLAALLATAELCAELGIEALFYVTPVDVETGEELLPGAFRMRVAANARLLATALRSRGAKVLDLSMTADKQLFSWQRIPNEHLDEHGRALVAGVLAGALTPGFAATSDADPEADASR